MKLKEIAELVLGRLKGDPELEIKGVASLESAKEGDLSFVSSSLYASDAKKTLASALIVSDEKYSFGRPAIIVDDAHKAFVRVLEEFYKPKREGFGIHGTAVIGENVKMAEPCRIGAYVVIERDTEIDRGVEIGAHCYLGKEVKVGEGTKIYPRVTILDRVEIGKRCIIHSGTVIGSDGFGFFLGKDGHKKIPQIGGVLIGDDVEIGANCTIDRASLDFTEIGSGTKFDNLVHIAHSVKLGKNCIILAGTVIGGSSKIGDNTIISGHVTIKDHIKIGSGVTIVGRSAVLEDVKDNETVWGFPAMPFSLAKRAYLRFKELPDLFKRVTELEKISRRGSTRRKKS